MMNVSMVKLYNVYTELRKEKVKGSKTVSGILSKLGINMGDYWQSRRYKYLITGVNFKERQITINLPYYTTNENKYIPAGIIEEYYIPMKYPAGTLKLRADVFHGIKIKTNIQVKEYIVDLDKIFQEVHILLKGKKISAQYEYDRLGRKIEDLEKKRVSLFKKLELCADFEDMVEL